MMNKQYTKNQKPGFIRLFVGFGIILFSMGYYGWVEILQAKKLSPKYSILMESYILPTDTKVIKAYNRDVVLLQSSKVMSHPAYAPSDMVFSMMLGTKLVLRRIVEYCQWHEYISETNSTSESRPEYYKSWSPKIIDSMTFKEPEGHINNMRDPLSSREIKPKFAEAEAFRIDYSFFEQMNFAFERHQISEFELENVPSRTKKLGFYFASSHWFYSKISMETKKGALKQENITFIDHDREEEIVMNCESGDLRVGYEYQSIPSVMSFVGVQNDDLILPVRRMSGIVPIAAVGNLTVDGMINEIARQEGSDLVYVRVTAGIGLFVGLLFLNGYVTILRYLPSLIRSLAVSLMSMYIITLGIWIYYYGISIGFVQRAGLWFGSHLVLIVLLNLMFYMIRLYRYAVTLQKERVDKKKDE